MRQCEQWIIAPFLFLMLFVRQKNHAYKYLRSALIFSDSLVKENIAAAP
jgi:hypothetical protein